MLLIQWNIEFKQQTEELQNYYRLDYIQFIAASTQYTEETWPVLEYISKMAIDCTNAVGKKALHNLNHLAVHNKKQVENVEMLAEMEELARGMLERQVEQKRLGMR